MFWGDVVEAFDPNHTFRLFSNMFDGFCVLFSNGFLSMAFFLFQPIFWPGNILYMKMGRIRPEIDW